MTHDVSAATGAFSVLWLIVALPLLSAAVLLLGGRRTDRWGHWLGTAVPLVSFVLSVVVFIALLAKPDDQRFVDQHLYSWIFAGRLHIDVGLYLDPLSVCFLLLITGVGSLIHIYSIGYMAHDPDRRRFFAYLNLFVAAMLLLVLGDSYATLYVGWEGVGPRLVPAHRAGTTSGRTTPRRPRRRSSSTGSVTSACRSRSS